MKPEGFALYTLAPIGGGHLAISPQPSRQEDFATIKDWRPDIVVTMTTTTEFPKDHSLSEAFDAMGAAWHHLPITDFGAPAQEDADLFAQALTDLSARLSSGSRILIHCKGGQGRSGMLALRLMIMAGETPTEALARLRAIRPGAVETEDQLFWATNTV